MTSAQIGQVWQAVSLASSLPEGPKRAARSPDSTPSAPTFRPGCLPEPATRRDTPGDGEELAVRSIAALTVLVPTVVVVFFLGGMMFKIT